MSENSPYVATILRQLECSAMAINGTEVPLHVLCLLSRRTRIMDLVTDAKTETSQWIKRYRRGNSVFAWQAGYGVFSIRESKIRQVRSYLANQEENHRPITFQDECRELCRRHRIDLDERYVWDEGRPVGASGRPCRGSIRYATTIVDMREPCVASTIHRD